MPSGRGVGALGGGSMELVIDAEGLVGIGRWTRIDAAALAVTRSESALVPKDDFPRQLVCVIRALFRAGPSSLRS